MVFLLPDQSLADGTAAAIYIKIPLSDDFRLLGAIANDKQSAIFKLNNPAQDAANANPAAATGVKDDIMVDDATLQPVNESGGPNIVLGISVEPVATIQSQLANLRSGQQPQSMGSDVVPFKDTQQTAQNQLQMNPTLVKLMAQRIIKNAFNFLLGFANGSAGHETVPLKTFQDWWAKFEKRVDLDPGWLDKIDD